ncbi:chemotaxis protein CheW [Caproiciproducens sp.]
MLTPYQLSENSMGGQFLPFKLDNEIFAIESTYVTAISKMLMISPLPGTPEYCKGIAKVEGKILPVIDMRLKLRKNCIPYNDETQIIMVNLEGARSGLIVDTLAEGLTVYSGYPGYPDGYEEPLPKSNPYFKGIIKISGSPAMVLDCKKILMEDGILDLAQLVS